jgi:hypothetical protein
MEAIPTQVAEWFEAARESADRDADDDLAKRAASNVDAFAALRSSPRAGLSLSAFALRQRGGVSR